MFIASLNNSSDQTWELAHREEVKGTEGLARSQPSSRIGSGVYNSCVKRTQLGMVAHAVIPTPEKLRQENCPEASLGYIMPSSEACALLGCLLTPTHLDCVILHGHEVQERNVYWVWPSHYRHQLLLHPGIRAPKA